MDTSVELSKAILAYATQTSSILVFARPGYFGRFFTGMQYFGMS